MGGDFFSSFWKGGDFVNEFGKPWSSLYLNCNRVATLPGRMEKPGISQFMQKIPGKTWNFEQKPLKNPEFLLNFAC